MLSSPSAQLTSLLTLGFLLGVALSLPTAERGSGHTGPFELLEEAGGRTGAGNGEDQNGVEWFLPSDLGHRAQKRRYGLSDPRSLFANIYGNYGNYVGYRKRLSIPSQSEVSSYYYGPTSLALASRKRGLGDRYDPRNLFRAIYGYRK